MPRLLVDVSDVWLNRYTQGVSDCVDTLDGLQIQTREARVCTLQEAYQLLENVADQLLNLKRNVEAWRFMF